MCYALGKQNITNQHYSKTGGPHVHIRYVWGSWWNREGSLCPSASHTSPAVSCDPTNKKQEVSFPILPTNSSSILPYLHKHSDLNERRHRTRLMLHESKQGCHVRNTPAFWQRMKGELLMSTPVTDRVPVKAGPKVKGSFDISKGELMHLNVDAVVYNKMMPQLLLDQKTHKKRAHGISVFYSWSCQVKRKCVCSVDLALISSCLDACAKQACTCVGASLFVFVLVLASVHALNRVIHLSLWSNGFANCQFGKRERRS